MVIKIVEGDQVVCDCEGDIPELWLKCLICTIVVLVAGIGIVALRQHGPRFKTRVSSQ